MTSISNMENSMIKGLYHVVSKIGIESNGDCKKFKTTFCKFLQFKMFIKNSMFDQETSIFLIDRNESFLDELKYLMNDQLDENNIFVISIRFINSLNSKSNNVHYVTLFKTTNSKWHLLNAYHHEDLKIDTLPNIVVINDESVFLKCLIDFFCDNETKWFQKNLEIDSLSCCQKIEENIMDNTKNVLPLLIVSIKRMKKTFDQEFVDFCLNQ